MESNGSRGSGSNGAAHLGQRQRLFLSDGISATSDETQYSVYEYAVARTGRSSDHASDLGRTCYH